MSILSAFDNLGNSLVESAATDEFKQLLAEIADIETDIKTLQKEVSDGWTKDFKHQLSDIEDEIRKVRGDLWDIVKSYEIEEFWGYDEDGHKEYSYWTDKDKQREVAMLEATIRKKLEQVEAMHAALEKQLKQDHETAYATQTRNIRAKTTARDDKKKRKEELLKNIIEEERPELEELIKKISEYTTVHADISKISFNNGKLFLDLVSDPDTIEIDYWDDIDYDDDYASVNTSRLESRAEDWALDDGFLYDVAYGLGFDDEAVNNIDFTFGNNYRTIDIPGSSWKLLTGCDLEGNEPSVSVYGDDVEVEEDYEYTITCYLVKEI